MCALWENFMDSGNRLHLQIQLFLQLNVKVIKLLDEFSPKFGFYALPEAPAKQVFAMGCSMAQVHLQISEQCDESAIRAFNITAKTHFPFTAYSYVVTFTHMLFGALKAKAR